MKTSKIDKIEKDINNKNNLNYHNPKFSKFRAGESFGPRDKKGENPSPRVARRGKGGHGSVPELGRNPNLGGRASGEGADPIALRGGCRNGVTSPHISNSLKIEKEVLNLYWQKQKFDKRKNMLRDYRIEEIIQLAIKKTAQEIFRDIDNFLEGYSLSTDIRGLLHFMKQLKQKWGMKI